MEPGPVVVIDADEVRVAGRVDGERLLVPTFELPRTLGWELKPEGLCRDDVCVPVRDRDALVHDGHIDVASVAAAIGRVVAIDPEERMAVVGAAPVLRRRGSDLVAADVTVPDLDGRDIALRDFAGRKRLLLAWASW